MLIYMQIIYMVSYFASFWKRETKTVHLYSSNSYSERDIGINYVDAGVDKGVSNLILLYITLS